MSELKKQQVECSFYESAFKTAVCVTVSLESYLAGVKNGKYEALVKRLRSYKATGDTERADNAKKKLPLLVAGGVMEGGRKLEHMVRYSQCTTIDLDDVPGDPLDFLRRAETLDYVKAGHISPSGTGNKLFVLVDSSLPDHVTAFGYVSRMIERDLPGVKVDTSGKDANRSCFVSYDPDAFYKEVAQVVHVPVDELKAEKQPAAPAARAIRRGGGQPGANALSNYIDRFESDNPFADGGRHSYLVRLTSALNSAGFAEYEVETECLRRYSEPGFGEKEIRGIVADIYRRYRSAHGSNPYDPSKGAKPGACLKNLKNLSPAPDFSTPEDDGSMGFDIEAEDARLPHFGRDLFDRLPKLLADAVAPAVDDTEFDLMLLAGLTVCSTALPGVTGNLKDEPYAPPFYTLLIGPSGSGKGCIHAMHKVVEPWQRYVADMSRHDVEQYKKEKEAYDTYKFQQRYGKKKTTAGPAPTEPKPVFLKQLHMSGYTTTARMIEQLHINDHYASLMFETELESVTVTLTQDFGGYGYLLNQIFHHETISSSSKTNGSFLVRRPMMGLLATGTPGMLAQLVPSTESGLFSRLLIYKITGHTEYRPLTSSDNVRQNAFYYDGLGLRLLDIAIHLDKSPTFVSFSDKQRKRLDRYFKREYYNVRVFNNNDVASVVLRHRLIIFRMAMVLTALRKGESLSTDAHIEISDEDFETAFHIGTRTLQHSLLISTSMKHGKAEHHYKIPTIQLDLFADMPDEFRITEILELASVRGISRATVYRMLKKAQEYKLLISVGAGCYRKTEEGKNVKNSETD